MTSIRLLLPLLGLALCCSVAAAGDRIKVVTTTSDLRSLVQEVGKERVEAINLAPPTRDVEAYEPRPQDAQKLRDTKLVVRIGLDYDLWFNRLLADASSDLRRGGKGYVDASIGVPLLEIRAVSFDATPGHSHGAGNPHYWLDPANAEVITGGIMEGLIRVDPERAQIYESNRNAFLARLKPKIEEWRRKLERYAGAPVIAYHNSWPYLARRFRLNIIDSIEPKPGIAPSPSHLAGLIKNMKARRVSIIIKQPFEPEQTPKMLAERVGARVVPLAPSVGSVPGIDDYLALIEYDVSLLATAFEAGRGGKP
jgi:ABC-type Zn uptake system ZnuABC Zn-binding protein ZnuA